MQQVAGDAEAKQRDQVARRWRDSCARRLSSAGST
jgi:hypothetical protein